MIIKNMSKNRIKDFLKKNASWGGLDVEKSSFVRHRRALFCENVCVKLWNGKNGYKKQKWNKKEKTTKRNQRGI